MPVLSRFYGMIIKMYFLQREHNPPHIHAIYENEYIGVMDIKTQKLIEGDLTPRAEKILAEWVKLHEKDLLKIWETQEFTKLPPLE